MTSLQEFAKKWDTLLADSDLPQPIKAIADFVKEELQKEKEIKKGVGEIT